MLRRVLSTHNTSAATTAADLEYAAVAVTVASGTTAPALSRTVPLMTPFWTCAATDAAAKTNTKKMLARSRILPPNSWSRCNNSTGDSRGAMLLPNQRRIAGNNAKTRAIVVDKGKSGGNTLCVRLASTRCRDEQKQKPSSSSRDEQCWRICHGMNDRKSAVHSSKSREQYGCEMVLKLAVRAKLRIFHWS